MSRDVEVGIHNEGRTIFVKSVEGDRHFDQDEDEGASYSKGTTLPRLKDTRIKDDGKRREMVSEMADDQTARDNNGYKIDFGAWYVRKTFKFIKMETKRSPEEMAKDAEKFVKIAEFKESVLICVDDAEKITDSWVEVVNRIGGVFSANLTFLTNGLGQQILSRIDIPPCREIETVPVISTSFATGSAVMDPDQNKQYFGPVDQQKQEQLGPKSEQCDKIRVALLLEDASPDDVMRYKLAILKAYSEVEPYCIKMITDGSKELLNSIADNSYFYDRRGVLILKNGGLLSSVLYSFIEAFRNGSEMVGQAEEDVKSVCQEYFSENDRVDVGELIIENIKQNIAKFFTFDETEKMNDQKMKTVILNVSGEGLQAPIIFLMDSNKEACDALSNPEYFKNNDTTLIYENSGLLPCLLANYITDEKKELLDKCLLDYHQFQDTNIFFENIDQNISKLKVHDANNPESNHMLSRVVTFMEKVAKNCPIFDSKSVPQKFSYLAIKTVLCENRPAIFEKWPCHQIEIDTFLFCNLRFHWHDKDVRKESKIAEHFGILSDDDCNKPEWQQMGTNINKAIEKLSNGIIANCFHEDGKPNVEIISPIQALIINRLFCMQFDFVKMLWKYDKENILVNTVMIWILINGILKEKTFAREYAADDLAKLKEYFAAAIKWPLDKMPGDFYNEEKNFISHKILLFQGQPLFLAAGGGKFCDFLTHAVTKRCITEGWNNHNTDGHDGDNDADDNDIGKAGYKRIQKVLNKPLIKFYIHMVMYAVSYLLLAYYTLQEKAKASAVIKWVLLTMISSLFVDELRQALGDKQYSIRISLKRWWSDGWNKLDAFSMMIYYLAFILDSAGVISASRLLFSTFTFIWCLKFYQFLRAFESLGTYIILVQKMLPQLGNFAIVALIAIISYGVFMTSILFPNITFASWSVLIMVLLRPYLLLFAETGINEYDLSTINTIYNTPKIETASEIIMVVGMCLFLMFGGVLLLNILIAIFSGIYEEVKEESVKLWALNDLQLLQEFQRKPVLPIPFSLPVNIFLLFKRRLTKPKVDSLHDLQSSLFFKTLQRLITREYPEWIEKQERISETVIRDIDTQVGELNKMCHSKHDELQTVISCQHEDVKEMLKEHQENVTSLNAKVDDMKKKIDKVVVQCREMSTLLKCLNESRKEKIYGKINKEQRM